MSRRTSTKVSPIEETVVSENPQNQSSEAVTSEPAAAKPQEEITSEEADKTRVAPRQQTPQAKKPKQDQNKKEGEERDSSIAKSFKEAVFNFVSALLTIATLGLVNLSKNQDKKRDRNSSNQDQAGQSAEDISQIVQQQVAEAMKPLRALLANSGSQAIPRSEVESALQEASASNQPTQDLARTQKSGRATREEEEAEAKDDKSSDKKFTYTPSEKLRDAVMKKFSSGLSKEQPSFSLDDFSKALTAMLESKEFSQLIQTKVEEELAKRNAEKESQTAQTGSSKTATAAQELAHQVVQSGDVKGLKEVGSLEDAKTSHAVSPQQLSDERTPDQEQYTHTR